MWVGSLKLRGLCWGTLAVAAFTTSVAGAHAQPATVLEFAYTPTARAQVAIWIEDENGKFLATVALTEAVAYRGIGNRPGASEMNSGYRWPYGRREGVLPIWAHRRASAPGAKAWPRVIYQNRPEGYASKMVNDQSPDDYYCLQFDSKKSRRDQLDAVSCATPFHSDKGRYLTQQDVAAGYSEPWVANDSAHTAGTQPLPLTSLYPPRMDVTRCTAETCFDHADIDRYAQDARTVMPDIDAVTRATAPGDTKQTLLFTVPADWPAGDYVAFIEVNVEGDYNDHWNDASYPTPLQPAGAWDTYSSDYGYAYRGQPSIVYRLAFRLGGDSPSSFSTDAADGRSSWDVWSSAYGEIEPISYDDSDPHAISNSNGSGADRLRSDAQGHRFTLRVRQGLDSDASGTAGDAGAPQPDGGSVSDAGAGAAPSATDAGVEADAGAASVRRSQFVGPVTDLRVWHYPDRLRSHAWVKLRFRAAASQRPIHEYEVRVATLPITDSTSFIRDGRPARSATDDPEGATALMLPADTPVGEPVETAVGDLVQQTHYYIAVRATDDFNRHGPVRVAEITTTTRSFATVTPCFVATAAYGCSLAHEIGVLRHVRDRYLLSVAPGRVLVHAYYALGPALSRPIRRHAWLRSLVRALLEPIVACARALP